MTSYLAIIQPNYSEKINHIRAIFAFWIFVFHYYHFIAHSFFTPLNSSNPLLLLIYHGYFSVYLFFLLSGFLLAKAYSEKLDLQSFLFKRIGRIFPAYYLCIAVYYLFFITGTPNSELLLTVFSANLGAYPTTIGHLWFINRLLECYLCFPLLWWIAQKTGQTGLILIYLLCLFGGGYWVIYFQVPIPDYYFSFVLCFSFFVVGILTTFLSEKSIQIHLIWITLFLFGSTLVWFHHSTWQTPLDYSWMSVLWLNFIAVLFSVVIRAYLFLPVYMPHFISIMLRKLGNISYSFYLYHFLVIQFFIQHKELLSSYNSINFFALLLICIMTAIFFQQLLNIFFSLISTTWNLISGLSNEGKT